MKSITTSEINQKINALPHNLLEEVNNFIDFLTYKSKDWADDLSVTEKKLIEKGINDISEDKTYTHKEAKEIIKNHIKNKTI